MNPILRVWLYENWLEDQKDNVEIVKNHAYLLGSFWNPEAVRQLTGEGGQTHVSSEEELEESTRMVLEDRKRAESEKTGKPRKKRRRKIKE